MLQQQRAAGIFPSPGSVLPASLPQIAASLLNPGLINPGGRQARLTHHPAPVRPTAQPPAQPLQPLPLQCNDGFVFPVAIRVLAVCPQQIRAEVEPELLQHQCQQRRPRAVHAGDHHWAHPRQQVNAAGLLIQLQLQEVGLLAPSESCFGDVKSFPDRLLALQVGGVGFVQAVVVKRLW